jgi:sorting nexin-1/2
MPADPHHIEDDEGAEGPAGRGGPRVPPPVQAATPSPVRSSTQPSMSIEQAAKPSFNIYVGDPHKVGDLTSSHIVYAVRTRVSLSTIPH